MAAKQGEGQLEDAIFLADLLLKQQKEKEDRARAASSRIRTSCVGKDAQGCPLKRRSRSGETCRRTKVRTVAIDSPVTVETSWSNLCKDEIQQLQQLLVDQPSTSSSWCLHQSAAQLEWQKARSITWTACCLQLWYQKVYAHIAPLLLSFAAENACPLNGCVMTVTFPNTAYTPFITGNRLLPTGRPSHSCNLKVMNAIVFTKLCLLLGRYDLHLPKRVCNTCHYEWTPDWGDLIRSGYWPASVNGDTLYSTDVFKSFEDLKTVAPGLSRQAFLQMLKRRTQHYGRTGKIHGDVFQRSFLEYMACQYECQKMTCEEPFSCPACTPKMLAVSVDGNGNSTSSDSHRDEPLFKGPFIMEDSAVTDFVDKVRT
ncbi:hypothetical protein F7725_019229, partial [Dissostichus mawsoni]